MTDALHRIQVKPTLKIIEIKDRIERHLGVETYAVEERHVWAIYFDAPADVNLDFLRPDVLPPE